MEQIKKQTEERNTEVGSQTAKRIITAIFGLIEVLLTLRFVFKLLGANASNGFIKLIYSVTHLFVVAFDGIFPQATTDTIKTSGIFEPGTLIAMLVIALITWFVLSLIRPSAGNHFEKTEKIEHDSIDKQ